MTPTRIGNAFVWQSGMEVDADGAPQAYRIGGGGLDAIGNAQCKNGSWCGAVVDARGRPIVQGPTDPAPGFLVSPTSLRDKTKPLTDPTAYVDASTVPYLAICPELRAMGVSFGDLAMACYGAKRAALICADGCPHSHYGETSIAGAAALGIPSSPRNGGASHGVTFLVFPGSASTPAWPRDVGEFKNAAEDLFTAFGGQAALTAAFA